MQEINPYAPPASDAPGFAPGGGLDPADAPLASRGSRLGAAILDGLLQMLIVLPIQFAMGVYDGFPNVQPPTLGVQVIGALSAIAAYAIIHGKFLADNGQTVGKKMLGIRIAKLDGSKPPMLDIVLKRFAPVALIQLVPVVNMLAGLINVLLIFGSSQRCGHDLIAGTKVVEAWKDPE